MAHDESDWKNNSGDWRHGHWVEWDSRTHEQNASASAQGAWRGHWAERDWRGGAHNSSDPKAIPRHRECGSWSWHSRHSHGKKCIPCKFGAECRLQDQEDHCARFHHPEPLTEKSSEICSFFTRGLCTRGDSCKYEHPQSSTVDESRVAKICSFFVRGFCNRGEKCPFAHPEQENLDRAVIGGRAHGGNARDEVLEEILAETSGVRAVYSHGGQVMALLYPEECISVVAHAALGVSEDEVCKVLSSYGELLTIRFQNYGKGGSTDDGEVRSDTKFKEDSKGKRMGKSKDSSTLVAYATFLEKESASRVLLDGSIRDKLLSVEAGGVQPPRTIEPITGFLSVQWNVGDEFDNISDDDEDAFDIELTTWTCSACTLANSIDAERCVACDEPRKFDTDRDVWSCIACTMANSIDSSKCVACEGPRSRRATRKVLDQALRLCVPMLDRCLKLEPYLYLKNHKHLGTLRNRGVRVHLIGGSDDVQQALRMWKSNPSHLFSASVPRETKKSLYCLGIFFAAVRVETALFEWWTNKETNLLQAAIDAATKNGIKPNVRRTKTSTTISLNGSSVPQLLSARGEILKVIASDVFSHPLKDMLFTPPGHKRLRDFPFYVKTEFRTRNVRLYGMSDDRQRAQDGLRAMVTELGTLVRLDFTLRAHGFDCQRLQDDLGLVEEPILRGKSLTLWVSADQEDICQKHMDYWTRKTIVVKDGAMCSLCLCEFDDARHQLLGCGHTFCVSCLENCLREPSASHFPLLCQGPSPVIDGEAPCLQPICWADIVKLAPPESLVAIKSVAVQAYLLENPKEAVYCGSITGSGCNALVRPENGQVACAQCGEAYCVYCSSSMKRVVDLHPNSTCEQAQIGVRLGVQEHRRRIIDEFLTVRCPKCATAFEDFSACAALTCASCNVHFCGKCISAYFSSSSETHEHVKKCTDGGALKKDDNYFISMDDWHKNNLRRAKEQVEEYLNSLEPELRIAVIHACRSDFTGRSGGDIVISESIVVTTPSGEGARAKPTPKPRPMWR